MDTEHLLSIGDNIAEIIKQDHGIDSLGVVEEYFLGGKINLPKP